MYGIIYVCEVKRAKRNGKGERARMATMALNQLSYYISMAETRITWQLDRSSVNYLRFKIM